MRKDYTKYDAVQLAGDSWFIKWIVEGDPKANRFWSQWLKDHPELGGLVADATKLVKAVKFKEKEPSQKQISGLWDKINTQIDQEENQPQIAKRIPLVRWISYAAAAAVATFLAFYFLNPTTSLKVGNTERLAYYLPDSSFIEVNAASQISYNPQKWEQERTVKLKGEAFFEVEKGNPFKVITPKGSIEVLGTSFNVKTHDDGFKVECFTGTVKVRAKNGDETTLTKGEKAQFNFATQKLEEKEFDTEEKDTWRQGFFDYYDTNCGAALAEIERQFDVNIETTADIRSEICDVFFTSASLRGALENICSVEEFEYNIDGKTVIIKRKNASEG